MIIIVNNYINDNLTIAHLRLPLSCILNPHVGLARVDYVLIKRGPKIVPHKSVIGPRVVWFVCRL